MASAKNTEFKMPSKETILEEYDQLEQVPPAPGDSWGQHDAMVKQGLCEKAAKKINQSKNRYCNLYPFDKYIFNFEDPDQYINASWVKILPWFPTKRFIATMAPLEPDGKNSPDTRSDFWQMIWESKTKLIVMMCSVTPGFTGCSQYFPDKTGDKAEHGNFLVKNIETQDHDSYVERSFDLVEKNSESRQIVHLQFKKWPNYGVPDTLGPISEFIKLVHEKVKRLEHPDPEFVVHCSGGIGRSGTLLTAYGAYCHFLENKSNLSEENMISFSLFETVKALRLQRHPWMVEGIEQYQMAYAISNFLKSKENAI